MQKIDLHGKLIQCTRSAQLWFVSKRRNFDHNKNKLREEKAVFGEKKDSVNHKQDTDFKKRRKKEEKKDFPGI